MQNAWQRLTFDFNGRLDAFTSDTQANQLVVMFDAGWNTGDTFYIDNVAIYTAAPAACHATSAHVDRITVSAPSAGGGSRRGRADVTIEDDCGSAVAQAAVTGIFTGSFSETRSATTGSDGVAAVQTGGTAKGPVSFTFCVDAVSHASLPYRPMSNLETCKTF